jgi:hypothetical protein
VGNVKVDLRKVRCEAENWIEMAKDRVQWLAFVISVLNIYLLQ